MLYVGFQGYRTGHAYRHPITREKPRQKSDVEIPATVTAYMFAEDGDGGATRLPYKFLQQRQQREKTRWLNSPNSYTKVSMEGGEERYNSRTTTVSSFDVTNRQDFSKVLIARFCMFTFEHRLIY